MDGDVFGASTRDAGAAMILAIAVGVGGSLGAVSRYLLDGLVQDRTSGRFPFGTLTVNVVGSFILGCIAALASLFLGLQWTSTLVGTGFCGGMTTWSTASWETIHLAEQGATSTAVKYLLTNLAASLIAAGAGFVLVWR